jgi:hypothetical protein
MMGVYHLSHSASTVRSLRIVPVLRVVAGSSIIIVSRVGVPGHPQEFLTSVSK